MKPWNSETLTTILAISKREMKRIWFDARLRSIVFVAPFVYAALFAAVYMNHAVTEIPIGLVQEEYSAPSRTLVRMIESNSKLNIAYRVDSIEELKDLMIAGKIDAGVVIPKDFSLQLKRGKSTTVVAYVNAATMVAANTAGKGLNEVIQTFSAGVEIKTLMRKGDRLSDAKEKFMPVKMDLRSLFNPSYSYANFMVPGLLAAILQQVILLGMALSWTGEKEGGSLGELFSISRNPWVLIAGKLLPYFVINMLIAEFYLRVLFPLSDIPMEGAWYLAIPFTALFILTIVSWGLWVSCLCKTRLFATQMLMFLAMPSFVLSGFTWPQYAMPWFMQFLGNCLPLTYFVSSFRRIYLAGIPFEYASGDIAALLAFTAVNLIVGYFAVKRLMMTNSQVQP